MPSLMWTGLLILGTAPQWLGLLIVRLEVCLCGSLLDCEPTARQADCWGWWTYLGLLLNSPVYPSRQCCFQCSQGRVLAGVGGQLLLWNAITSLSWSIKGFNIFCTCYNGNLFKFLLLWLCSSVLPLWFLLPYLLWPKKSASSSLGRRKSPLTTGWENLSQLCILICLGLIQRPSALQVSLFCVISILSVFLWEKQN